MKQKRKVDKKLLKEVKAQPCSIDKCGRDSDPCHIRTRGSGGDDVEENLIPMCRIHHIRQTCLGWARFVQQYPKIGRILNQKGWELIDEFGQIKLRRKEN